MTTLSCFYLVSPIHTPEPVSCKASSEHTYWMDLRCIYAFDNDFTSAWGQASAFDEVNPSSMVGGFRQRFDGGGVASCVMMSCHAL